MGTRGASLVVAGTSPHPGSIMSGVFEKGTLGLHVTLIRVVM